MPPTGPPAESAPPPPVRRGAVPPGRPRWAQGPGNPRTVAQRTLHAVEAEVAQAEAQRAELEAMMARTGQGDALLVAPVVVVAGRLGAHTATTWIEGRICVLARSDVVELFAQPRFVGADPFIVRVRWDVVARVCGPACWNPLPDVVPPRVVTRRWPDAAQMAVLTGLTVVDRPGH